MTDVNIKKSMACHLLTVIPAGTCETVRLWGSVMRIRKMSFVAASLGLLALVGAGPAFANGLIVSSNGNVQIGINDNGSLDANTTAGTVGIGYNFTGQGSRTGFQDALTPGCLCEAWGVSYNGATGGQIGDVTGNQNITTLASSNGTSNNSINPSVTATFTSNTVMSGLGVTQVFSLGTQTATGALFKDTVTLTNNTGATINNLRYARAMDWDVPPTEFNEFVTFKGTGSTPSLVRSTDDGFANANPLTAATNAGIIAASINADGTFGPADHGGLFVFDFGSLTNGSSFTFNIFYGAGANKADALALLSNISPELYNIGESTTAAGGPADSLPSFVFAFNGVGGTVVVPPSDGKVPEPLTLALFGAGVVGMGALRRRRKAS